MDNDDTLKELFRTATQHPTATTTQSELGHKKGVNAGNALNPLLASILAPQKTSESTPPLENQGYPSLAVSQDNDAGGLTAAPEPVNCETINISQVKHPSDRSTYGSIISVTGRAIAYVLNGKKIRFIAQENASMGLLDAHEPARLPVIDLAWYGQNEVSNTGDLNIPATNLLASLTKGAEVRVGAVFSDSNTSLAYEGLFASIFPELAPARGLAWGSLQGIPLLAVFGEDPDIFLVSLQGAGPKVVYVSTGITDIKAIYLDSARELLLVASLLKVEAYDISDLDDVSLADSISLPEDTKNIFLVTLSQGPAAVTLSLGSQLSIRKFCDEGSELSLKFVIPTQLPHPVFIQADPVTDVICIGCHLSDKIYFFKTNDNTGTVACGTWPNRGNAISVCSSGQLHSVYRHSRKVHPTTTDFFLYVYNQDSVKMHHFEIDWGRVGRKGPESTRPPMKSTITRSFSEEVPSRTLESQVSMSPRTKPGASTRIADHLLGTEQLGDVPISTLLERNFDKLTVSLASDLDKSCQRAVRDAYQKLKSKSNEPVAPVHPELMSKLGRVIEDSIKTAFERQWLTNVQDTITATVARLSDRISQAIIEASQANHRMIMRELAATNEKLQALSAMVGSLPNNDQIRGLLRPISQADDKEPSEAQIRARIESLIRGGNPQEALVQVLEEGNLPLLNWILGSLDASLVVKDLPIRVALSLIQQVGHDLSSHTESKLNWLSEILAEFDPRTSAEDPSIIRTMNAVFEEVFSNLRVLFAQTPSTSSLHKQTKLVMRLLRGAMTS